MSADPRPHSKLRDFLRRLSEWDVLNLAPGSGDDGPYWQREIVKANIALDSLEEQHERFQRIVAWYWRTAGPYPTSVDTEVEAGSEVVRRSEVASDRETRAPASATSPHISPPEDDFEAVRQCLFGYSGSGPIPDAEGALRRIQEQYAAATEEIDLLKMEKWAQSHRASAAEAEVANLKEQLEALQEKSEQPLLNAARRLVKATDNAERNYALADLVVALEESSPAGSHENVT